MKTPTKLIVALIIVFISYQVQSQGFADYTQEKFNKEANVSI